MKEFENILDEIGFAATQRYKKQRARCIEIISSESCSYETI